MVVPVPRIYNYAVALKTLWSGWVVRLLSVSSHLAPFSDDVFAVDWQVVPLAPLSRHYSAQNLPSVYISKE